MKKVLATILSVITLICSTGCDYRYICEHSWEDPTCTKASTCTFCGETKGSKLGHLFEGSSCERCYEANPDAVSKEEVLSEKPEQLFFNKNSVGGINFGWKHKYIGSKVINYITVNYTLYDAVGNPTSDDIKGQSEGSMRLIGPFNPGENIDFVSDIFVYCSVCAKVSFDSLKFEYADGTVAYVNYGWYNTLR